MTGYDLAGSKLLGRWMKPQMSVVPSRPLAANRSGGSQPAARNASVSASASTATREPSLVRRISVTGGRSTRDHTSTKFTRA